MGKHAVLTANAIDWTRKIAFAISTLLASKIIYSLVAHRKFTPEFSLALSQLIVVFYFISWFLAAIKGIKTQADILNSTGGISSKMPAPGIFALLIGFPIGAFAMILALYGDELKSKFLPSYDHSITEMLVSVLAVFWLWDMAWHFLVRNSVKRMIFSSKEDIQQLKEENEKNLKIEKINALEMFIFGNWRIYRILFGLIFIFLLLFLRYSYHNYIYIPKLDVSLHIDVAISMATFAFIFVSEGWIWIMRIKLCAAIDTLKNIGSRYHLEKI